VINNFFTIGFRAKPIVNQDIGNHTQGIKKSVDI
jgi:hypothetical protein